MSRVASTRGVLLACLVWRSALLSLGLAAPLLLGPATLCLWTARACAFVCPSVLGCSTYGLGVGGSLLTSHVGWGEG